MLYNIHEVNDSYYNTLDILDDIFYLTEEESYMHPIQIPIVSFNGNNVIEYSYFDQFISENNISIAKGINDILEVNNLDNLTVAVPDYEILLNPDIVSEEMNIIIQPISEESSAYKFCEECISTYEKSGDENWLNLLVEGNYGDNENLAYALNNKDLSNEERSRLISLEIERQKIMRGQSGQRTSSKPPETEQKKSFTDAEIKKMQSRSIDQAPKMGKGRKDRSLFNKGFNIARINAKSTAKDFKKAWSQGQGVTDTTLKLGKAAWAHKGTVAAAGLGAAGLGAAIYAGQKYIREARNKPKSWIAKKIASLRSIYQKYLARARAARDKGQASMIQKIASRILQIIDKLLYRLQRATD